MHDLQRDDLLPLKKYGSPGMPEIRELRARPEETRRLKQLVADLSLDGTTLQESLQRR